MLLAVNEKSDKPARCRYDCFSRPAADTTIREEFVPLGSDKLLVSLL
jgi:hypothetical protein